MAEKPPKPESVRQPWHDGAEEPTNPKMKALQKKIISTRVLVGVLTGVFSTFSVGGVLLVARSLRAEARDAGAEGAKDVVNDVDAMKRAVNVLDADLQTHKAAAAQAQRELKEDVHAMRDELRELYKSNRTGDRSPVLEKPVPPLPPPPPPAPPRPPLFVKDGGK